MYSLAEWGSELSFRGLPDCSCERGVEASSVFDFLFETAGLDETLDLGNAERAFDAALDGGHPEQASKRRLAVAEDPHFVPFRSVSKGGGAGLCGYWQLH
jgi:hypothetical protein